jgi:hypothetical protein
MARSPEDLRRLAQELTALTPEERARVLAEVRSRNGFQPPPRDFSPPLLTGGTRWIGGALRRETLYGDDGR